MLFNTLKDKLSEYFGRDISYSADSEAVHFDDNGYGKLYDLDYNVEAEIKSAPEDPKLKSLGFRRGKNIIYEGKEPLGGPLLVSIEGRKIAIDEKIASKVYVENYEK